MTGFVLAAAAVVVVLIVVAVVLARRGVRRLRRRLSDWASRVVGVRSRYMTPGPRRDAALLRERLDAELRSTRDMLEQAPQGVIFRADATAVLQELATTAVALDAELAAVGRFLDPAEQRAALKTITPHVRQLIETTYLARQTILRTAAEDRTRRLNSLQANIADQAAALDTYRTDGRELTL